MANTPAWVTRLTEATCAEHNVPLPNLIWRRSKHSWSSGHTRWDKTRVVVTAGTDPKDRRMVLLHELAHWILLHRSHLVEGHSTWFWEVAFGLYRQHGLVQYATEREGQKYQKARAVSMRVCERKTA